MLRSLFVCILLLCAFTITGCGNDTVYMCDTETAYAYHRASYCIGLANCSEEQPVEISEHGAKDKGRKPCSYCYEWNYENTRFSSAIYNTLGFLFITFFYYGCCKYSIKIVRENVDKYPHMKKYRILYEYLLSFLIAGGIILYFMTQKGSEGEY